MDEEDPKTAEGETRTSSGTTEVKYVVTEAYTWSIPKTIDFGSNAGVNKTVTVSTTAGGALQNDDSKVTVIKNVIPEGKTLTIKVGSTQYESTYRVKAENSNNTYLPYTIKKSEDASAQALTNNDTVLTLASGTNEYSQPLVFTLTTNSTTDSSKKISEVAGSYKDTLTFTATVETNN